MIKKVVQKTLNQKKVSNFSALRVINPQFYLIQRGFIIGKLQSMFKSRSGIYRMLALGSFVHILGTFTGSMFIDRKVLLNIEDYMDNQNIKENELFQIFGVLKQGSIKIQRGTLDTKFVITDFKDDLDIFFSGSTKFEFKEGETIVLTGYMPNKNIKNKIVCIDYQTKHSMEQNNWQGYFFINLDQANKPRNNFGLN